MKYKLLNFTDAEEFAGFGEIEYRNDQLFMIDAESKDSLIMNKRWRKRRRVSLTDSNLLQSGFLFENPAHLLTGNAEAEKGLLVGLPETDVQQYNLGPFYRRLNHLNEGKKPNIRSSVFLKDQLVFSNISGQNKEVNQLIVTETGFLKNQEEAEIQILPVDFSETIPGAEMNAITYSPKNDWLIFSAQQVNNLNPAESRSWIGIIENASRKIGRKKIKINSYISLSGVHSSIAHHKIKSVCIQSERTGRIKLLVLGSNETGVTGLFRIRIKL